LMPAARENVRAHLEKLKNERLAADEDGRWTLQAS
jgi:beta-lactamase-like protein